MDFPFNPRVCVEREVLNQAAIAVKADQLTAGRIDSMFLVSYRAPLTPL